MRRLFIGLAALSFNSFPFFLILLLSHFQISCSSSHDTPDKILNEIKEIPFNDVNQFKKQLYLKFPSKSTVTESEFKKEVSKLSEKYSVIKKNNLFKEIKHQSGMSSKSMNERNEELTKYFYASSYLYSKDYSAKLYRDIVYSFGNTDSMISIFFVISSNRCPELTSYAISKLLRNPYHRFIIVSTSLDMEPEVAKYVLNEALKVNQDEKRVIIAHLEELDKIDDK